MPSSTHPQREQCLKLIEEKAKIEKKIADLGNVLATVRNVNSNQNVKKLYSSAFFLE